MATYCFDLDGTLCQNSSEVGRNFYLDAEPIRKRIAAVNALYDAGHIIIVDTARGSVSGDSWLVQTKAQLDGWGLKYHRLRCGDKLAADIYVDDRAINAEVFFEPD